MRWNAYAQAAGAIGQIVITLLLVRLLDASDFGRLALVYLVAGLVALLDEGSFSTRLIATDEQRSRELNVVFWQELLVGLCFSGVILVAAPSLALIYDQPDLTAYLLALAPVFIITGPRRFYQTLLVRALSFQGMGIVRMVAVVVYIVLTVVLATAEYGVWSLVYGLIARMIVESIGFTIAGFGYYRPKRPPVFSWKSGYGRPGVAKVGERVLNYLIERLDIIIIGKALGADALGVYDVFKRLSIGLYQQVVPLVMRVGLPVLAKLQTQPTLLAAAYLEQVRYICYLLFPAYLFQALFAEPIVAFVFGVDWLPYVPIFVWISLLLLVRSVGAPVNGLLMARGFVKRELIYTFGVVAVLAATILYFVQGGLEAVVVAITWLYVAMAIPVYVWVVRPTGYVKPKAYFKALLVPLVVSAVVLGSLWLIYEHFLGATPAGFLLVTLTAILLIGTWLVRQRGSWSNIS